VKPIKRMSDRLRRLAFGYLRAQEQGEAQALEKLASQYPDDATALADFAAAHTLVEQTAPGPAETAALARESFALERRLLAEALPERLVAASAPPTDPRRETEAALRRLGEPICSALGLGEEVVAALIARSLSARSLPGRLLEELAAATGLAYEQL
jgi:hypothetical protein